jgi:hypothetical protein
MVIWDPARTYRIMKKPWGPGAGTAEIKQRAQPWVGRPENLSKKQLERAAALKAAAEACKDTTGAATYKRRRPGRHRGEIEEVPAIAVCVAEKVPGKVTVEELYARRRAYARKKRAEKKKEFEKLLKRKGISVPTIVAAE